MKFSPGDTLFYINPFVFTIEKVQIEFAYKEDDGTIYYVEQTGAYLDEADLTSDIDEAIKWACQRLERFYYKKQSEILNTKSYFRE